MIKLNEVVQCVIATAIVVFSFQFSQWNVGLNLWDEGFLWYGVQQVMSGAVPIRDFMAYDPGRYYAYAALMTTYGSDGVASFRLAGAIIQFFSVLLALLIIFHVPKENNFFYKVVCALTLVFWMYARYRYVDIGMSIVLVAAIAYLLSKNDAKSYFVTGALIGVVAVFGRNHGVYGLVGLFLAVLYLFFKNSTEFKIKQKILVAVLGLLLGFSPVLYMSLVVPNYYESFLDSLRFLLEIKSTNIVLPIPWPWAINYNLIMDEKIIRQYLVGSFFLFYVLFIFFGLMRIFTQRRKSISPVFLAAVIVSIPYLHFALSRADLEHLTTSIFPVLIGSFVWINGLTGYRKVLSILTLSLGSVFTLYVYQPGWYCYKNIECSQVSVTNTSLLVDGTTANDVLMLKKLVAKYADNSKSFLITPYWPGAYAVLRAKSPIWEIYALFPRGKNFELNEIERVKAANVGFVFVLDHALDGRDDLRYRNTHPLIYNYVLNNFNEVNESDVPYYHVFKLK